MKDNTQTSNGCYKKVTPVLIRSAPAYAALALSLTLSGCATLINGQTQAINVQTQPEGAICTVGDRKITTPADMIIKKGGAPKTMKMVCERPGYEPATVVLQEHGSVWVIANVLNGIVPGVVIDSLSGGGSIYEPERVSLNLEAAHEPAALSR